MPLFLFRTVLVASLSLAAFTAAAQSLKVIVPGKVRAIGDTVSGTFKVVESKSGIPSTGIAGACLVTDLSRRACQTDADADCRDLRTAHHPNGWAYSTSKIQHRRQDMLDPPGQAGRLLPDIAGFPVSTGRGACVAQRRR